MLSLILPTYNESENLPELIPAIENTLGHIDHEIIIVDDDSPDGTWKVALDLAKNNPHIRPIRRVGRRGLSSAVIEGFLSARGDVLAVMDADGQHDISLLPKLASTVDGGASIAIGSRYVEGGTVGEWDERRHMMSRIATRMAIRLCKVTVTDPMSGFFAISRAAFERALPSLNPKGFKILLDLLIHVPPDATVAELPFSFGRRAHGESKLSTRVQIEFLEYLYDATVGRFIPLTLIKYGIVGALGVFMNVIAYLIASRWIFQQTPMDLLGYSPALLVGIEAAILFNFLVNNSWTFAQVKLRGMRAVIGFVRFNVACIFGALANYAVTEFLLSRSYSELAAVGLGALVGMMWNYTMSRLITWRV